MSANDGSGTMLRYVEGILFAMSQDSKLDEDARKLLKRASKLCHDAYLILNPDMEDIGKGPYVKRKETT